VNLSHLTLRRLTRDLAALTGSRIQAATLSDPNQLTLDIAHAGGAPATRLLISGSRSQGRICITDAPFPRPVNRPTWIDRYLLNAAIQSIRLIPNDRILIFNLDKQDRVGSRYPSQLIVEMIAQDSNAILIDANEKIQGLLRTHSAEHRKLHPGATYIYPPAQDRQLADAIAPDAFARALAEADDPVTALLNSVACMDRHLAKELTHRAEQSGDDLLTVTRAFYASTLVEESLGCICNPGGMRMAAVAFTPTHISPDLFESTETISQAIVLTYQDGLKGQEKRGQKKALAKTISRAIKAAVKKRDRIAADLENTKKADQIEQMGSLILSQSQAITAGASTAEVNDLFADKPRTLTIPLDPKLSAAENGQAYLKKAAKAKKSAPVLMRRLSQTAQVVVDLETLARELEVIEEESKVETFREKLVERGLIRPERVKPRQGKIDQSGLHPRKYRTSDGWEVWVGRNDQENDRMTKSAPKRALWFHAHGCPGSHVVLRPRNQRDPSPEAMHDAASLAAYWSKARGAKTVPVNYTEARYVQKPRGAPAGLVTIQNEKTLFVQPREIDKWDAETME
jgi:predicted ribosome quality control (RQC) complex YloA/Tae2 family protein